MTPFILGVVGDSGSGKNTLADAVTLLCGPERVADVRLDDYHRYTREERAARGVTALNPTVHNLPLMREHLQLLRQGRQVRNRSYEHADGTFGPIRTIEPREIVVARGLLGYPSEEIRALYDLAVFLQPEAELLFRWKLRRDVLSRGYTEAEVLKYIANHLLDAKQFVIPQAERADVLIRHDLAEWDAPDSEVQTSMLLRGRAAAAAPSLLQGLPAEVAEPDAEGAVAIRFPMALREEDATPWLLARFADRYDGDRVGVYLDEQGVRRHRPQLALVAGVVAALALTLREG